MRSRLSWLLLMGAACSQGDAIETSTAFTTLGDGGMSMGDDSTSTGPPGATMTTSAPSTATTTSATTTASTEPTTNALTTDADDSSTTSVSTSSSTDPESSSSGPMDSTGAMLPPQPVSGWWEHCVTDTCPEAPMVCLSADDDGVCTHRCTPAGNTASCQGIEGTTAVPVCLALGADSICALDCSGGRTCAQGMVCVGGMDDTGPFEICL